jgi:acyl-CoA thioester hydrolase
VVSRAEPATRDAFKAWRTLATRWSDNDVYGHVNNTVFYQWFDSAVNAWLIEAGLLDLETGDPIGIVAETRCSFFAPLAFPDSVDVGLAVAALGRSSIRYRIGIFAVGSDTAAAQGEFVHVLVGRSSRRPAAIPEDWRRALEAIS